MDNQPTPDNLPEKCCAKCDHSRLVRMSPSDIQQVRACIFLPPHPVIIVLPGAMRPTVMPSMHSPVMDAEYCKQFAPIQPTQAEAESTLKLLGDPPRSKLIS